VVDDAGGDDIATTKVFTDVAPMSDGTIRLDFTTPEAFVNAIEILRELRITCFQSGSSQDILHYRDSNGNVWVPDRNFFGGRLSSFRR